MNYQVGVSHVHQVDSDSNFVPVLGLKPPSKILAYTEASQKPPRALGTLVLGHGLGKSQSKANRVHQAQTDKYLDIQSKSSAQECWHQPRFVKNIALASVNSARQDPPQEPPRKSLQGSCLAGQGHRHLGG